MSENEPKTPTASSKPALGRIENLRPFKPGQSGNPSGKSKTLQEFTKRARKGANEAIIWLRDLRADSRVDNKIRLEAAKILIERGYGKAPQTIELTGPDGGPVTIAPADFAGAPLNELEQRKALLLEMRGANAALIAPVIDATFVESENAEKHGEASDD